MTNAEANGKSAALAAQGDPRREEIRARIPNLIEVYLECPLAVLVERDVRGSTGKRFKAKSKISRECPIR